MKNLFRLSVATALLGVLYFFPGCNKVKFDQKPGTECHSSGLPCTTANGIETYDYDVTTDALKADLLFAVDSSASMYSLQTAMGTRFPTLFQIMQPYDYHIGIVTLDMVKQPGQFMHFSDGSAMLSRTSASPQSQFLNTIQRSETLACQQWITANCNPTVGCQHTPAYDAVCPSEDTRAIAAVSTALDSDPGQFFRANVPLSVVILSNSDERAAGGVAPGPALEPIDDPVALINKVKTQFNNSKTLTVHSIVIRPGDTACYNSQHVSTTIFGWYANIYTQLAGATGGSVGNICAPDYGAEMGAIGTSIASNTPAVLPCPALNNSIFAVTLTPNPGFTASPPDGTTTIRFPQAVPGNTHIHVHYQCTVGS